MAESAAANETCPSSSPFPAASERRIREGGRGVRLESRRTKLFMKRACWLTCLAALLAWLAGTMPRAAAQAENDAALLRYRWVYVAYNLQVDANVAKVEALLARAKAAESLAFFARRGHRQILAGYYDHRPDAIRAWREKGKSAAPGSVVGVMYTTWANCYDDLEAFARAAWGGNKL